MKIQVEGMNNKELQETIEKCEAELKLRRQEKKSQLINAFEEALSALRDNHIKIRYTNEEEEAYQILIDDDIGCFEYSYGLY